MLSGKFVKLNSVSMISAPEKSWFGWARQDFATPMNISDTESYPLNSLSLEDMKVPV